MAACQLEEKNVHRSFLFELQAEEEEEEGAAA